MPVTLDPTTVPHIFEAILIYLTGLEDHKQTIYNAREVSRSMREAVDRLPLPNLSLSTLSAGLGIVEVLCSADALNEGPSMPLPAFSDISELPSRRFWADAAAGTPMTKSQTIVLSKAKKVTIEDKILGHRDIRPLAASLSPDCSIVLTHGSQILTMDTEVRLPAAKTLEVVFNGCICRQPQETTITHLFTSVTIRMQYMRWKLCRWNQDYDGSCPFWEMVLQPQVTHLEILVEYPVASRQLVRVIRSALKLGGHQTNPDLQVVCTPYYIQNELIKEKTQTGLADALRIPKAQVTINPSKSSWREDQWFSAVYGSM